MRKTILPLATLASVLLIAAAPPTEPTSETNPLLQRALKRYPEPTRITMAS